MSDTSLMKDYSPAKRIIINPGTPANVEVGDRWLKVRVIGYAGTGIAIITIHRDAWEQIGNEVRDLRKATGLGNPFYFPSRITIYDSAGDMVFFGPIKLNFSGVFDDFSVTHTWVCDGECPWNINFSVENTEVRR